MHRLLLVLALASSSCATADVLGPPAEDKAKEDPFAKVEIKSTHVAGNVFMLEGAGGNIAVSVGEDGALIVDDQFAPLADKIRDAIDGLRPKTTGEPLKFVLNTHWHSDHAGGNAAFGEEAVIVAHDNVRERLRTGLTVEGRGTLPPAPKEALPVVTFADTVSLHFNGERIDVVYLDRGHTDGDVMVLFRGSKVVHMGDDFVTYGFPFVDVHSGGDVLGLQAAVAKAIEAIPADYAVIPGHGNVSTLDDMKGFARMLDDTIATVREHHEAGKTLAQAKKSGLSDEWKDWAGDFVDEAKWIELIWTSLEAHAK